MDPSHRDEEETRIEHQSTYFKMMKEREKRNNILSRCRRVKKQHERAGERCLLFVSLYWSENFIWLSSPRDLFILKNSEDGVVPYNMRNRNAIFYLNFGRHKITTCDTFWMHCQYT